MSTDVVLDDPYADWVTLKASVINGVATDLILDHPARRKAGSRGLRRALVHDSEDGLTLNYNSDYPGGITLNEVAYISPLPPPPQGRDPFIIHTVPELKIDGGVRFVWDNGLQVGGPVSEEVSLQSLIADLRSQVADLTGRVQALENA